MSDNEEEVVPPTENEKSEKPKNKKYRKDKRTLFRSRSIDFKVTSS